MGKKDVFRNDIEEELNIDIAQEDGIEDVLDTLAADNWDSITDLVSESFGQYIEPAIVEALVDAYEIDIYQETQPLAAAVYSVYMKEYS